MMKHNSLNLLAAGVLAASAASAAITIDTVQVGDPGNTADGTGIGAVSYDYYIGTYEVTNGQYTAFLNATAATDTHELYNTEMDTSLQGGIQRSGSSGSYTYTVKSGFANKPVNFVSFYDSARFANWLMNGQPTGGQTAGTTEDGFYTFSDTTTLSAEASHSGSQVGGTNWVAVASEDEWYKAAYYDGSGGYFEYPTQSDDQPAAGPPPGGTNSANFNNAVGTVTDVGAYTESDSHYGTFDQGGNVWEWNDTESGGRGLRGGGYGVNDGSLAASSSTFFASPGYEDSLIGFRVTSLAPIPEPSTYALILGCLGLVLVLMRRRKN